MPDILDLAIPDALKHPPELAPHSQASKAEQHPQPSPTVNESTVRVADLQSPPKKRGRPKKDALLGTSPPLARKLRDVCVTVSWTRSQLQIFEDLGQLLGTREIVLAGRTIEASVLSEMQILRAALLFDLFLREALATTTPIVFARRRGEDAPHNGAGALAIKLLKQIRSQSDSRFDTFVRFEDVVFTTSYRFQEPFDEFWTQALKAVRQVREHVPASEFARRLVETFSGFIDALDSFDFVVQEEPNGPERDVLHYLHLHHSTLYERLQNAEDEQVSILAIAAAT